MPRPFRSALHLIAAALVAAAVGLTLPAGPAAAATCSSGDGVSVVVDFHQLGGGLQTACVAGGGGDSATSLFSAAGFPLSYVQRQPGFVCQVSGQPASDPCVNTPPADAYWGLWWSDGTSGRWTYATTAAGSLHVPDGGYVAFSWNGSASRSAPGASPTAHPAAPTRTPSPSAAPTKKPTKKPKPSPSSGTHGSSTTLSATLSASPSTDPSSEASPSRSASASSSPAEPSSTGAADTPSTSPEVDESPSDTPTPTAAEPADPSDGGLPTWVGPVVVILLFAAGGTVAVVRRRGNAAP
ncbi:hypothetical protein ASC77_05600 [Nocardioides sp. Root1257]|uniref:hypothetical protein n=1 Tax=unclassified Nocardioides TaxID=2615069 RepID=UPI0006F7F7D0|nr:MULTISPECIES: hypothetical protein [unclassified Nocardioides]KQW53734.1 hypothetical protein ASC77_05600 [Nocardioides sp. Root1257]KRC56420.1 hypothetical protein ASE24_05600 [Nocardioides sp. Root224]